MRVSIILRQKGKSTLAEDSLDITFSFEKKKKNRKVKVKEHANSSQYYGDYNKLILLNYIISFVHVLLNLVIIPGIWKCMKIK